MAGTPKTFGDQVIAQKTRDVIRKIVRKVLQEERPVYRYGKITAVDKTNYLVTVDTTNGAQAAATYPYFACSPFVGQRCLVEGLNGDRFVRTVWS